MTSLIVGELLILTTDKAQGNLLASFFASEPNDDQTFDRAAALRPVGSSGAATHWGGPLQVKLATAAAVNEYNTAGPYPILNGVGLTNTDVADFKVDIQMQLVPRGTGRQAWADWLTALNLEIIPPT